MIAGGGFGSEAQVPWYGPLAYALLLGALGFAGGAVLALLPMDDADQRGWTPALALLATLVPIGLAIALFRVRRDVFHEQMPPVPVLLALLGGFGLLALLLFFLGPRFFRSRAGAVTRPLPALALLAAVTAGGAGAAQLFGPEARGPGARARGAGGARGPPELDPRHGRHAPRRPPLLLRRRAADPELCSIGADGTRLPRLLPRVLDEAGGGLADDLALSRRATARRRRRHRSRR